MASLRIISETGFFHIACHLRWDRGKTSWIGWQPVKGGAYWSPEDVGRGWIEREDKDAAGKVNHYVTFRVADADLDRARHGIHRDYVALDDTYGFGMRDCVTFARDVAEYCGLDVGGLLGINLDLFPYELLIKLYDLNGDAVIASETDLGLPDLGDDPDGDDDETSARRGVKPPRLGGGAIDGGTP
ncbi:MAG: hypothetical protein HKO98_15145 [Gemmatimonadetes bacterium]|nr:hypothetical protein [Gemmatimonadota bacterium]